MLLRPDKKRHPYSHMKDRTNCFFCCIMFNTSFAGCYMSMYTFLKIASLRMQTNYPKKKIKSQPKFADFKFVIVVKLTVSLLILKVLYMHKYD